MRVLVQRVSRAEVRVDGEVVGRIGAGLLLFVGVRHGDGEDELRWLAHKVAGLRVFRDDEGKMNRSLVDVGGAALVVSQFTLYGDSKKGMRPSFVGAAPGPEAEPLVARFVDELRSKGVSEVATGRFAAMMEVDLVNDGPVTLWLEREPGLAHV